MSLIRIFLMIFFSFCVLYQGNIYVKTLPIPIVKNQNDPLKEEAKIALIQLKAPVKKIEELSKSISTASRATNLSPTLITCIIATESSFNGKAISSKNYKGYMQTPTSTNYSDVDILHGARIFKDKLRITDNNYEDAMMLYKGGRNSVARKQARETLKLYSYLKGV